MNKHKEIAIIISAAATTTVITLATLTAITAHAQPTGNGPVNLTKYFEQNKDFQSCIGTTSVCTHDIEVLYERPYTLALKYDLIDVIWKAVDFAKAQGYRLDAMSTYELTQGTQSEPSSENRINVMVGRDC